MELKQLQFFVAVSERLNFSRAADSLYISQPALSYQIAELEHELGVELFFRERHVA
ncbi:LysR family transcriptional regulator [Desulfovibrio sp. OttesenSCG-928-F07]|nr:LysR family transcriptional regulator [Desulfovibrio sp. OttesenSCG-928-F07]